MRARKPPLATANELDDADDRERRIREHMRRVDEAELMPAEQRRGVALAGEQKKLFDEE